MPDWSYQTLFRPLLFRLPAPRARTLTLGALGALGAARIGPQIIALMGHTRPAASLAQHALGLRFPAPIGIGADLPGNEAALNALARFGVGYVEVGPVALADRPQPIVERLPQTESIGLWGEPAATAERIAAQLASSAERPARVIVRLAFQAGASAAAAAAERVTLIAQLAPFVDAFTLTPPSNDWGEDAWRAHLVSVVAASTTAARPLLVGVAPGSASLGLEQVVGPAVALGIAGVLICCGLRMPDGAQLLGAPVREPALATVHYIRRRWGGGLAIFAAGGVCEPRDALALLDAGANFVQLDAGLVYGGPGLPKRINEAVRLRRERPTPRPILSVPSAKGREGTPSFDVLSHSLVCLRIVLGAGWLWMLLLGIGMMIGGMAAWLVAATSVVLPYDEAFVGMARHQLDAVNPRLLAFMAHDRIALAGTMVSIGVLYSQLAWHALRQNRHWAYQAIAISAAVGFLSFFLFLGYGYFDPLHALVALLLLPLFLLGLRARADAPPEVLAPDLRNDRVWRLAQWGQLGMVGLGIGLLLGGVTVAVVGVTTVFVPQDLAFLCTTPTALRATNERLMALVAHDRAGFGGALVSDGLGVLLVGLWGVRRGARWVWWTLLGAGAPGFLAALGVHVVVGYLDAVHLFPGIIALVVYVASLALLYPYLSTVPSKSPLSTHSPVGTCVKRLSK